MIAEVWDNILLEFQNNDFLKGGAVVSVMMAMWSYFRQIPSQLMRLYHRYCTISVEIPQGSTMFIDAAHAIFEQHKNSKSGEFAAGSKLIPPNYESEDHADSVDIPGLTAGVTSRGDSLMPFGVRYHRLGFCVIRSSISERKLEMASPESAVTYAINITVFGFGKRKAIGKLINSGMEKRVHKSLRVKLNERDYWQYGNLLKHRSKSQVVVENIEEIINDLKTFRNSAGWYATRGIPYRRGVLFYGPPGTGKSSLAQVIANELAMDLHVLNLSGISAYSLRSLLTDSNKLILIEDMDVACEAAQDRKKSGKKADKSVSISLSDILNAVDGVSSGSGNILMITTNDKDKLDPALLRPGRIDKHYEIGYLTQDSFDQLCKLYYGKTCGFKITSNLTAATVQGIFIENPNSIEDFEASLWKNHSQS